MVKKCNVCWGGHCCDRKYGHANPICMCGNGCSFLHFDTGTVLQKTEIKAFLAGDRTVGMKSGGYWAEEVRDGQPE